MTNLSVRRDDANDMANLLRKSPTLSTNAMGRTEPPLMFPAIAGTQIPTELTSLEELAATGDLETLRKDLWAVWKQPQQSIDLYRSCLYKAQLHDHVQIGSYLLSLGMTIAPSMFVSAVRSKSYDFLELYLSYGYDINALERESRPPALMYEFQ